MAIKWNEVTWYSKLGAIILFLVVLPILAFIIGERYEEVRSLERTDKIIMISDPKVLHDVSVSYATSTLSKSSVNFTISTPIVSIPSSRVAAKKINDDIKTQINAIVTNYSSNSAIVSCTNDKGEKCSASVDITATTTASSKFDTVSIELDSFSTSERMAHPDYEREAAVTYDLGSGATENYLTLLGSDTPDLLAKIQTLSRKKLKEQFPGTFIDTDDVFLKGTEATADNYKFALMDEQGIRVIFSYYQVGPRPVGAPEVFITYKELGI